MQRCPTTMELTNKFFFFPPPRTDPPNGIKQSSSAQPNTKTEAGLPCINSQQITPSSLFVSSSFQLVSAVFYSGSGNLIFCQLFLEKTLLDAGHHIKVNNIYLKDAMYTEGSQGALETLQGFIHGGQSAKNKRRIYSSCLSAHGNVVYNRMRVAN